MITPPPSPRQPNTLAGKKLIAAALKMPGQIKEALKEEKLIMNCAYELHRKQDFLNPGRSMDLGQTRSYLWMAF